MPTKKTLSSLTLSALLLLVLGIGNLVMGRSKSTYFSQAIEAAYVSDGEPKTPDPLLIKRLQSRKRFYGIVLLGGGLFIASALGLLGLDLVRRRRP